MRTATILARRFVALLAAAAIPCAAWAAPPLAVRIADVDAERSTFTVDGQVEKPDLHLLQALLAMPGAPERRDSRRAEAWELRIVFGKPAAVGTVLFLSTSSRAGAAILRPDFAGDPAQAVEADWRPTGSQLVLAPGAQVRAVRIAGRQTSWDPAAVRLLLLSPRLDSATPEAVGSGEPGPFGSHPNAIPRGEAWVNAAADPRPGAAKQIPRGPVSDALPSWYILSWDAPQTLVGLRVRSNVARGAISVYRGDPKQNPALAGPKDWLPLPEEAAVASGSNLDDRYVSIPPTKTLAVRLAMTKTNEGPVASIERFDALLDLGDRPLPERGSSVSPYRIAYEQPVDGMLTMSVVDSAGRPVRSLVAQVDRTKGPQVESWDLRDDAGEVVPPGEYRWKAITSPPLELRYQFSVYPNVSMHHADRLPWLTGESGPNGWLADHSSPSSGAARGDKVYFAAPWVESGVSLIECDTNGKKLWARHGFGPFAGPDRIAAEADALYTLCRDKLERLDPATKQWTKIGSTSRPGRGGAAVGMAASGGKLYVAFHGRDPVFENAARGDDVDLEHCLPLYPEKIADSLGARRTTPNPRLEFLRLLRLAMTPAGQDFPPKDKREGHFPIDLETVGDAREQFVVVAFKSPIPLGSVVVPHPGPEYRLEFAALRPDAPYPPDPRRAESWEAFPVQPTTGWSCVAAPEGMVTRGLRLRVVKAGEAKAVDDPLSELLDAPAKAGDAPDLEAALDADKKPSAIDGPKGVEWFARVEGMRILRRRFAPLPPAKVRTSSGAVAADGVWDAKRAEPLSEEKPAVYLLEWDAPQAVSGLAVKELDAARAEVDVWEGAGEGPIALEGVAGWKKVASYEQARRDSYHPAFERNDCARYLDGMIDFGGAAKTRAVRIRVVAQWTDNGDRGTASGRRDREARALDLRRCKLYGVLALKALGGEPPLDALAQKRIEVRDGHSGEVRKELPVVAEGGIAVGTGGELYCVSAGRVFRIDTEKGESEPVVPSIDGVECRAQRLAVGPDGSLFVYVLPQKVVQVHRPSGEFLRTIGKPGGQKPGPWDPEKFLNVAALVVDGRGGLWVIEDQYQPRRIVQFHPDGSLAAEHLGNTSYGGGGVLDRFDKSRLFYGRVQFELDWETGRSKVKNLLAEHLPDDLVPIRHGRRTYLASAPLSHQPTQPTAYIYLLDEASGTARAAAAFGEADDVDLLKASAVLAKMTPEKAPKDYTFLWTDRDGDGAADPDEVEWELKPEGAQRVKLGRFTAGLRLRAGGALYEPAEVLANGTPRFVKRAAAAEGLYELGDGKVLAMSERDDARDPDLDHTVLRAADGKTVWKYPTSHPGVSGLYLPPWKPGVVTNEFGVIGHETEERGDLGEYFVTSGNNGRWNLWTADGLLAGHVLRHKLDPRGRDLQTFRDGKRGAKLEDLTAGQEHFHAYFTRTEADGRSYIVHGHNLIAVTEVLGLDRFQRLGGALSVSVEDVRRVRDWQAEQARREVKSQARVAECLFVKDAAPREAAAMEGAKLALGVDDSRLYVRWTLDGPTRLRNTGSDFHRYFKTGAYVDLMLGADPAADAARRSPALGDLRLLVTMVDDRPQVVLYQPAAGAGVAGEAWETSTPAGGSTRFDRVVRLPVAVVSVQTPKGGGVVVDAAIPLAALGLKPAAEQRLRFDWGVQTSDDGAVAKRRSYWSNVLANGTTDEAVEARLEPHLWGQLVFTTKTAEERRLDAASAPDRGAKSVADDLLEDLDKKR